VVGEDFVGQPGPINKAIMEMPKIERKSKLGSLLQQIEERGITV
jgi:microsomal dipeptidase-like Zn-dependent dipeptidase